MKSPSALETEFTPEDFALVEEFEAHVENYFANQPNSSAVTFTTDRDPRIGRRHISEAVRRMRAAGWRVTPKHSSHLFIERPPLGEVETSVRLRTGCRASNLAALVQVVGGTPVQGLLDVYFDDLGLDRLRTMHRLGTTSSPTLRLLTSARGAKHLSSLFVKDAFAEMQCPQGEVRVAPAAGHEGRFFILAGSGIVSIGCSLNKIDVNERAFRTSDAGEIADFETRWSSAVAHS